jgi:hypothetical protein
MIALRVTLRSKNWIRVQAICENGAKAVAWEGDRQTDGQMDEVHLA